MLPEPLFPAAQHNKVSWCFEPNVCCFVFVLQCVLYRSIAPLFALTFAFTSTFDPLVSLSFFLFLILLVVCVLYIYNKHIYIYININTYEFVCMWVSVCDLVRARRSQLAECLFFLLGLSSSFVQLPRSPSSRPASCRTRALTICFLPSVCCVIFVLNQNWPTRTTAAATTTTTTSTSDAMKPLDLELEHWRPNDNTGKPNRTKPKAADLLSLH